MLTLTFLYLCVIFVYNIIYMHKSHPIVLCDLNKNNRDNNLKMYYVCIGTVKHNNI